MLARFPVEAFGLTCAYGGGDGLGGGGDASAVAATAVAATAATAAARARHTAPVVAACSCLRTAATAAKAAGRAAMTAAGTEAAAATAARSAVARSAATAATAATAAAASGPARRMWRRRRRRAVRVVMEVDLRRRDISAPRGDVAVEQPGLVDQGGVAAVVAGGVAETHVVDELHCRDIPGLTQVVAVEAHRAALRRVRIEVRAVLAPRVADPGAGHVRMRRTGLTVDPARARRPVGRGWHRRRRQRRQ